MFSASGPRHGSTGVTISWLLVDYVPLDGDDEDPDDEDDEDDDRTSTDYLAPRFESVPSPGGRPHAGSADLQKK